MSWVTKGQVKGFLDHALFILIVFSLGFGIGREKMKYEVEKAFEVVDDSPVAFCLKEHFNNKFGENYAE